MTLVLFNPDKRQWNPSAVVCDDIERVKAGREENCRDYLEWTGSTSTGYSRVTLNRQD